ncbi:MAG: ATP-binding protein [Candidatus Sedimenticola sp. (ex Thyasira tokunagai)]
MKFKILPVKNVSRLNEAGQALIQRDLGMPGMGLIWGPTGYGKTTAATWFINQCHGVYIRAMRLWSPKTMLTALARELDLDVKGRNNGEMVEAIIHRLAETGRPVFIDEADYIVESRRLTDTLRDIHDLSTVPVILIGMHGIEKRIRGNEQFTGRIAQWVSFEGLDMIDARLLADGLAEVKIADDLLQQLHRAASPKNRQGGASCGAEVRRLVVGLGRIEQYARSRGLQSISAAEWTNGNEFFIGKAA